MQGEEDVKKCMLHTLIPPLGTPANHIALSRSTKDLSLYFTSDHRDPKSEVKKSYVCTSQTVTWPCRAAELQLWQLTCLWEMGVVSKQVVPELNGQSSQTLTQLHNEVY